MNSSGVIFLFGQSGSQTGSSILVVAVWEARVVLLSAQVPVPDNMSMLPHPGHYLLIQPGNVTSHALSVHFVFSLIDKGGLDKVD